MGLLVRLAAPRAWAGALTDKLALLSAARVVPQPLDQWRFHKPDVPGGEAVGLDASGWQTVAPGFTWTDENTNVWFRTRYVVPEAIGGVPTRGRLSRGIVEWQEVPALLQQDAEAGQGAARLFKQRR